MSELKNIGYIADDRFDHFIDGKFGRYAYIAHEKLASSYDDFYQHEYLVATGSYEFKIYHIVDRDRRIGREIAVFERPQKTGIPAVFLRELAEEFIHEYESKISPDKTEI